MVLATRDLIEFWSVLQSSTLLLGGLNMSMSRVKSPADKQSGDNAALIGDEDDIEAEQEEEGTDLITEPFDPAKIRVTSWEPTVELLMKRIRNNEIDIGPAFQRRGGIWSDGAEQIDRVPSYTHSASIILHGRHRRGQAPRR